MFSLLALILIVLHSAVVSIIPSHPWMPIVGSAQTVDEAFQQCGLSSESVIAIEIMQSNGQISPLQVSNVLQTPVLNSVATAPDERWFDNLPSMTQLLGVGVVVYEQDTTTNRDSFMLFIAPQEEGTGYRWWIALFRENIFLIAPEELNDWIVQEDNYCGLFEINMSQSSSNEAPENEEHESSGIPGY